jgi:hypothetical protein
VVHTVCSSDPLVDLPPDAAASLARVLLVPAHGDVAALLERCEAVRDVLDRWQDGFFASLPGDIDPDEEARWAEQSGVSLAEIEAEIEADRAVEADLPDEEWEDDAVDLDEVLDVTVAPLDDDLVVELETALLLLPFRVRLEALIAAGNLVDEWSDLLSDHEKCVGHLVVKHAMVPDDLTHDVLVDRHAALHAGQAGHA